MRQSSLELVRRIKVTIDITNGHVASNSVEFHFQEGTLAGFVIDADDRGAGYQGEVCIARFRPYYVDFEGFDMNNRSFIMNVNPGDGGVVRILITLNGQAWCMFTPIDPSIDAQGNPTVEERFPEGFEAPRTYIFII